MLEEVKNCLDGLFLPDRSQEWSKLRKNLTTPQNWVDYQNKIHFQKDNAAASTGLFVRSYYVQMYDAIDKWDKRRVDDGIRQKLVVSGSPGIGKSVFAMYSTLRKISETLLEKGRTKETKLHYWIKKSVLIVEIPGDAQRINTSLVPAEQHLKVEFKDVDWVISDPFDIEAAQFINGKLVDSPKSLFLLVMSPGLRYKPGSREETIVSYVAKLILIPWEKEEFDAMLKQFNDEFLRVLVNNISFGIDLSSMLEKPGEKRPGDEFFDLLKENWFNDRLKPHAKALQETLQSGKVSTLSIDQRKVVFEVLNYRATVAGYNPRLVLEGDVKGRMLNYYATGKGEAIKKSYIQYRPKPRGGQDQLNLNIQVWLEEPRPASETIKKFEDVRQSVDYVSQKLKDASKGPRALRWADHEEVCHLTLRESNLFPLKVRSRTNTNWKNFKIHKTLTLEQNFHEVNDLDGSLEINTYYKPRSEQQAVIDAFIYTKEKVDNIDASRDNKILLIQATVAKQHRPKKEPLKRIVSHLWKLLGTEARNTKWYFIFYISDQDFSLVKDLTTIRQSEVRRNPVRAVRKNEENQSARKRHKKNQQGDDGEALTVDIATYTVRLDSGLF